MKYGVLQHTPFPCQKSRNQDVSGSWHGFLGNLELFMKIVKKGEFIMTANLGTCFMFSI